MAERFGKESSHDTVMVYTEPEKIPAGWLLFDPWSFPLASVVHLSRRYPGKLSFEAERIRNQFCYDKEHEDEPCLVAKGEESQLALSQIVMACLLSNDVACTMGCKFNPEKAPKYLLP